jgi:hypothetical protein|eukprot:2640220-Prymnesium_polylepis.2
MQTTEAETQGETEATETIEAPLATHVVFDEPDAADEMAIEPAVTKCSQEDVMKAAVQGVQDRVKMH